MQSDLTDISHIFNHKKNPQQRQESATHFLFFYHLSGTGLLRRPLSVPPEPPSTLPSIGSNFHFQHHRIHRLASPHTHPHNTEQLRAQKGGARGGKTGFATLSAFPLANSHTSKCPTCQGNHASRLNVPLWKRNQIYASVSSRN